MPGAKTIPRKRLGQHFLRDPRVISKIVASLQIEPHDLIIEVGCGDGALTRELAPKAGTLIGIELDTHLFTLLTEISSKSTHFLNQDILTVDLDELRRSVGLPAKRAKIVGNLPYYISSPILEWLGQNSSVVQDATIMLQSEVADRLLASPGSKDYGVLTLLTQYFFEIKRLFDVSPKSFRPVPKVRSSIVRLVPQITQWVQVDEQLGLFRFIKRSFSQRRKTLRNCLGKNVDPGALRLELTRLGLSVDYRGEALSLQEFVALFKALDFPK